MKKIILHILRGNDNFLNPRDVRNYVGSIVGEEFKDLFMWHERSTPAFLYSRPQKNSIAIVTYRNDLSDAISHLCESVKNNPHIVAGGANATVISVDVKNVEYSDFGSGFFDYRTRTPLVVGSNREEIKNFDAIAGGKIVDTFALVDYIRNSIVDTITAESKDWFSKSVDLSSLVIVPKGDIKTFFVKYNTTSNFPAVHFEFVSNMRLPEFIGYKIGMGYGEIRNTFSNKNKKREIK